MRVKIDAKIIQEDLQDIGHEYVSIQQVQIEIESKDLAKIITEELKTNGDLIRAIKRI
jgi:hypothetical protein